MMGGRLDGRDAIRPDRSSDRPKVRSWGARRTLRSLASWNRLAQRGRDFEWAARQGLCQLRTGSGMRRVQAVPSLELALPGILGLVDGLLWPALSRWCVPFFPARPSGSVRLVARLSPATLRQMRLLPLSLAISLPALRLHNQMPDTESATVTVANSGLNVASTAIRLN